MSWTAGGGGTPTYYTVYVLENSGLIVTLDTIYGLSTSYSSLTNGSLYSFYVKATNSSGASSNSATSSPEITYTAGSPPSAPDIGSISGMGATLTLTWYPAVGGDMPTGFTVYLYAKAARNYILQAQINVPGSTSYSTTYTGTYGWYYKFYVVAYNGSGNSANSAYSSELQLAFL